MVTMPKYLCPNGSREKEFLYSRIKADEHKHLEVQCLA
jgi:hypothetical protein